jgi:hypothetical protein
MCLGVEAGRLSLIWLVEWIKNIMHSASSPLEQISKLISKIHNLFFPISLFL